MPWKRVIKNNHIIMKIRPEDIFTPQGKLEDVEKNQNLNFFLFYCFLNNNIAKKKVQKFLKQLEI